MDNDTLYKTKLNFLTETIMYSSFLFPLFNFFFPYKLMKLYNDEKTKRQTTICQQERWNGEERREETFL